jgi:hypothetical protein
VLVGENADLEPPVTGGLVDKDSSPVLTGCG